MTNERFGLGWAPALAALFVTMGCDPQVASQGPEQARTDREAGEPGPAGATCTGQDGCGVGQVCVQGSCRHAATSRAGEILASAAQAQVEAGDVAGAVGTYAQAIEAFEAAQSPLPPEVACGAAAAALRLARDPESRETAASLADRCFRSSLPGSPGRTEVQRALARLRYDGLDVTSFDRDRPAERFFTKQQSRPTTDAIEIALDLPARDHAGYASVSESIRSEAARQQIAECFVEDWQLHHRRSADAALLLKLTTTRRDMGSYDVFQGEVTVEGTGGEAEGFAACIARSLGEAVAETAPRFPYPIRTWQEPFSVAARIQ